MPEGLDVSGYALWMITRGFRVGSKGVQPAPFVVTVAHNGCRPVIRKASVLGRWPFCVLSPPVATTSRLPHPSRCLAIRRTRDITSSRFQRPVRHISPKSLGRLSVSGRLV